MVAAVVVNVILGLLSSENGEARVAKPAAERTKEIAEKFFSSAPFLPLCGIVMASIYESIIIHQNIRYLRLLKKNRELSDEQLFRKATGHAPIIRAVLRKAVSPAIMREWVFPPQEKMS